MALKTKPDPDRMLLCTETFATDDRVVHRGEQVRASDPIVGDGRWFVEADTPTSELPNLWHSMPDAPRHAPLVRVQTISIPAHRQVISQVDASAPMQWAKDSAGTKSGAPPPFAKTTLRRGQMLDALDPIVRAHPDWFRWPERHVLLEDLERLEEFDA
jgi:hypothetical protein